MIYRGVGYSLVVGRSKASRCLIKRCALSRILELAARWAWRDHTRIPWLGTPPIFQHAVQGTADEKRSAKRRWDLQYQSRYTESICMGEDVLFIHTINLYVKVIRNKFVDLGVNVYRPLSLSCYSPFLAHNGTNSERCRNGLVAGRDYQACRRPLLPRPLQERRSE